LTGKKLRNCAIKAGLEIYPLAEMSLVLDASITLAWIYLDETTGAVLQAFDALRENGAWVPALWRLEVANVLQMNVNRKRHPRTFRDAALVELALLPIHLDPNTDRHAWGETLLLAERHGLTVYDAAYLELALRRNIALATLDRQLRAAAGNDGVELLGM
jgi:predicted nucleic acid-binding protein